MAETGHRAVLYLLAGSLHIPASLTGVCRMRGRGKHERRMLWERKVHRNSGTETDTSALGWVGTGVAMGIQ